jgi:hypothetical protein
MFLSPSHIDPSLDSRSVTFENPTGGRGAGGQTYDGRKGRPSATIPPGETSCSPISTGREPFATSG